VNIVNFVNFFLSPLGYYLHPFSVQEPWDRLCVFFLQNLTEFGLQRRSFRSRAARITSCRRRMAGVDTGYRFSEDKAHVGPIS